MNCAKSKGPALLLIKTNRILTYFCLPNHFVTLLLKIVCTPADWTVKKPAMIDTSTSAEDINNMFPHGVVTHLLPSGKSYMRTVGALSFSR